MVKLTNSTVDCDMALVEKAVKAGRRGRVQKRNMQKNKGTKSQLRSSSALSDMPDNATLFRPQLSQITTTALPYFLAVHALMAIVILSAIKRPILLDDLHFSSLLHQLDALRAWCSLFFSTFLAPSSRSFIDILLEIRHHVLQSAASSFSVCGCSCCCARAVHLWRSRGRSFNHLPQI